MPSSWKKSLATILANPAHPAARPRVALVGIGNELNGDDAAGVQVARLLAKRASAPRSPDLLVIDAGLAPEAFAGPLRRFRADVTVFIDAADMGLPPGRVRLLDWRDTQGFGPSTHLQPLATLAEYLLVETGGQIILVGIQPAQLNFQSGLSAPVRRAVRRLADVLHEALTAPPELI